MKIKTRIQVAKCFFNSKKSKHTDRLFFGKKNGLYHSLAFSTEGYYNKPVSYHVFEKFTNNDSHSIFFQVNQSFNSGQYVGINYTNKNMINKYTHVLLDKIPSFKDRLVKLSRVVNVSYEELVKDLEFIKTEIERCDPGFLR